MKKQLKFREDATFKIVQFADAEFCHSEDADEIKMKAMMQRILESEKPDLVVYTGDVIASGSSSDAVQAFRNAVSVPDQMQIPWAVVFGNHDSEAANLTREQLHALQLAHPFCYAKPDPPQVSGVGNYVLTIHDRYNDPAAALYFLDSGSYSPLEYLRLGFYDWIRRSQINWYVEQSYRLTTENGGQPLPSLAFFHIPLPEYNEIWDMSVCYGQKQDSYCSAPWINTGFFAAMVEMGDIMGTFVGHDHGNDFWGTLHGIRLCYGRTTRNAYLNRPFLTGARIIQLTEGQRDFDSWLHLEDGTLLKNQPAHLPEGRTPKTFRPTEAI
ncbi:metallophosphoesterase family protein [Paenibacillus sp. SYP-B3998]|uniref:Metallophosphoesterase family protein n=1 Tax=Paenibacillus sp. SYP-B3998 TaxID=2678564 RepID=A0A6G3ZT42_9BACL|nr:metallophosphoesterase family protein [Paenibacillus sp. SYP-B3998]NEW04759.1 metallophosphoesterase family protein [Paenibacillus sp. SYP-B3998]